jgi:hypothetical protein
LAHAGKVGNSRRQPPFRASACSALQIGSVGRCPFLVWSARVPNFSYRARRLFSHPPPFMGLSCIDRYDRTQRMAMSSTTLARHPTMSEISPRGLESQPDWIVFFARRAGWLCVAAIVVLTLVPGSMRPETAFASYVQRLADSPGLAGLLEHFTAYAGAALLLGLGYRARKMRLALLAKLVLLAALLESAQTLVPGRTAALIDVGGSSLGASAGIVMAPLMNIVLLALRYRSGCHSAVPASNGIPGNTIATRQHE